MTHTVPKNTFTSYSPPTPRPEPKQTLAQFAKAPKAMGYGRPAQNSAGQP